MDHWEGCSARELANAWGAPEIHLFATVGSTNDVVRRLGEAGRPDGTIVLAEEQRAGRGRVGRSWSSTAGLGLWLSHLHRPSTGEDVGPLPLRVALAVAAALDPWCESDRVGIKWPNDLLIRGRKIGGILCEGTWDRGELRYVVIGIGLNLLHSTDDFPPEIRAEATSLRLATGRPIGRFEVASEVVRRLFGELSTTSAAGALPRDLGGRDVLRGRSIEVFEPETGRLLVSGVAAGVSAEGALLVNTESDLVEVRSGTVRLAKGRP
ncbi:MAG: biotin--[acetyl-CoA-carboxylase] ligase [Gemmatimonadota bacterium]